MGALAIHVVHVSPLGLLYRGEGSWGVWWASWRTCWPWPGSLWTLGTSTGRGGVMARHRSPEGVRRGIGRPKRRRRAQLAAWDRKVRREARDRARERTR